MKNNDKRIIYISNNSFHRFFIHVNDKTTQHTFRFFAAIGIKYQRYIVPLNGKIVEIYTKKKKNTITIFFQQFVSSFLTRIATKVRGKKKERVGGRKKKSKAKSLIEYQYLRLSRKLNGYIQEG